MKKILLLSLTLVTFLSFVVIFSESSKAIVEQSPAQKAASYCSTERKLTGQNLTNCKKAWDCGYVYWREKYKDHCKNSTNYQGLNIKSYVAKYPKGVLVDAIADGKKDARAKNVKSPSGSNNSTSDSSATTNTDSPGAGDNATAKEEGGADGISDNLGKDIVAGQVKLTGIDAKNAGIDNNASEDVIGGILNVVYSVSAVIAVIVIIVAGIMYIISDGDAARVGKAKSAIIYSAVGLVIIGSAFIITGIIQNIGM